MSDLPENIREIYEFYLESPMSTAGALRSLVHAHLGRAEQMGERSTTVDGPFVVQIAQTCLKLLDSWEIASDPSRRAIQAAVLYFADDKDGDDDFASLGGFDDDGMVVNHVCRLLGREDWVLQIPRR